MRDKEYGQIWGTRSICPGSFVLPSFRIRDSAIFPSTRYFYPAPSWVLIYEVKRLMSCVVLCGPIYSRCMLCYFIWWNLSMKTHFRPMLMFLGLFWWQNRITRYILNRTLRLCCQYWPSISSRWPTSTKYWPSEQNTRANTENTG